MDDRSYTDNSMPVGSTPAPQDMLPPAQPNVQPAPVYAQGADVPAIAPSSGPVNPPQSGSKWGNVLRGALSGLLNTGSVEGLVGGAIDPNAAQQVRQNRMDVSNSRAQIAMSSAESMKLQIANQVLDNYQKHLNIERQSTEYRQFQFDTAFDRLQKLGQNGMHPIEVIDDTSEEAGRVANDALAQGKFIYPLFLPGADGHHGQIAVYDATPKDNKLSSFQHQQLEMAGKDISDEQFAALPPVQQSQVIIAAMNGIHTVAAGDAKGVLSQLGPLQSLQKVYGLKHQNDPDFQERMSEFDQQISGLKTALDTYSNYDVRQAGAVQRAKSNAEADANIRVINAEAEAKNAAAATKPGNMLVGSLPDGTQVAGTGEELQKIGAMGVVKLPGDEAKKVIVARQMISPGGLFQSVASDMADLEKQGKLGVAASRWSDFMAGKVGSEPEFGKLRTDMGLLATALMQAHVGARGSHEMLQHFTELADYRISDAATLRAALGREFNYVHEKAMLPAQQKQGGQ